MARAGFSAGASTGAAEVTALLFGWISSLQVLELLGIGVLAGVVGGLLGVGGGIVMIPALALLLGERYGPNTFHVYKLAAITTSFWLSVFAGWRHVRAGAVVFSILPGVVPLAVVGVAAGVLLAGLLTGEKTALLRQFFGAFLLAVVAFNLYQVARAAGDGAPRGQACPLPRRRRLLFGSVVGLPAGVIAGLLGVGGGVWAVPAQRQIFHFRLQNAIANSSVLIVFLSLAAAVALGIQVSRLHEDPLFLPLRGLAVSLLLAPGALVGGWLGAGLTHRIGGGWLRLVFFGVLAITGARLLLD